MSGNWDVEIFYRISRGPVRRYTIFGLSEDEATEMARGVCICGFWYKGFYETYYPAHTIDYARVVSITQRKEEEISGSGRVEWIPLTVKENIL